MDYIQKEIESVQTNHNTANTTSIKNSSFLLSAISDDTNQNECSFNSFLTQKQFALECPLIEDINESIVPGTFEFRTEKDAPYRTFLRHADIKLSFLSLN